MLRVSRWWTVAMLVAVAPLAGSGCAEKPGKRKEDKKEEKKGAAAKPAPASKAPKAKP